MIGCHVGRHSSLKKFIEVVFNFILFLGRLPFIFFEFVFHFFNFFLGHLPFF